MAPLLKCDVNRPDASLSPSEGWVFPAPPPWSLCPTLWRSHLPSRCKGLCARSRCRSSDQWLQEDSERRRGKDGLNHMNLTELHCPWVWPALVCFASTARSPLWVIIHPLAQIFFDSLLAKCQSGSNQLVNFTAHTHISTFLSSWAGARVNHVVMAEFWAQRERLTNRLRPKQLERVWRPSEVRCNNLMMTGRSRGVAAVVLTLSVSCWKSRDGLTEGHAVALVRSSFQSDTVVNKCWQRNPSPKSWVQQVWHSSILVTAAYILAFITWTFYCIQY